MPFRTVRPSPAVALSFVLGLAGCGASQPPPEPPPAPAPRARPRGPNMQMASELGSLDERQVEDTFRGVLPALSSCLERGSGRVEFLGGHVKFFVRIGGDGRARWAYLEETTLGDRDTERCMLSAVRSARWPQPQGGAEGQARKAFDFDPSPDARPPVPWGADRAAGAVGSARAKIAQCRDGAKGSFHATAYVQTDGSVMAVGVAPPDEKGERAADCVIAALRAVRFPSPGSWPAKVSFDLD